MKSRSFPRSCINRFLCSSRTGPRRRRARGPLAVVTDVTSAARTSDVTAPTTCAGYFRGVDTSEITPATGNLSRIVLETFRLCVFRATRLRLRLALAQMYSFNSRLWQAWERTVYIEPEMKMYRRCSLRAKYRRKINVYIYDFILFLLLLRYYFLIYNCICTFIIIFI